MRPDSLPRLWRYVNLLLTYLLTCHRQRSTNLSTTYAHVWTRTFWTFCAYYWTTCIIICAYHWTSLSRLTWHNFIKVGDNWIKICNLAYIGTCNRCVKNRLKVLNRLWKTEKNSENLRGDLLWLTHCIGLVCWFAANWLNTARYPPNGAKRP